ncbi:Rv1355c family protein [Dyadobacter sp. CY343]|uniref:Rv1355c family protein n=1 Tax=Dyadobacter sp. CY343 TaxID=2907299 RepID=UPI001F02FD82|nr:Rv1355c family protein [Dyadobacter sp. CY343]MCE7059324.1 Rv1355c family protein [Dyadobacter sp. CY343]
MYAETILNTIYRPVFIPKEQYADRQKFDLLTGEYRNALILNLFESQSKELIKVRNPRQRLSDQQLDERYAGWTAEKDADLEGCWVYYPWSNRLLHLLDEADFIELRTARNRHKITLQEQNSLSKRRIGIIGLSVGHSVALTLATERSFGSLRLADFDTLELSNLNRIRTGIHNCGLNKSVITAREIAELDPFLHIECYTEGITTHNLNDFLTRDGKLDLLIDECDDIEIKIKCREAARPLGIPVVMETSDRGLLDVERFDLHNDRPILHGLLSDIPKERLQNISPADRVGLVMRIIDVSKASLRGRASLLEVGQSISTWPQLASAVTLGGGVVADVSRRILLDQFTESGRYYVDLEQLVGNTPVSPAESVSIHNEKPFDLAAAIVAVDSLSASPPEIYPDPEHIKLIVEAASHAPSYGDVQPWKWIHRNGRLYLFHDKAGSLPFLYYKDILAHFALGAAFQNVVIKSAELGYHATSHIFPADNKPDLVATIEFSNREPVDIASSLSPFIHIRATDRSAGESLQLTDTDLDYLGQAAHGIIHGRIDFIQDSDHIRKLAEVVGACDLVTLLHHEGHADFFGRVVKTNEEANAESENSIPLSTYTSDPGLLTALSIVKDKKIAGILKDIDGGNLVAGLIGRTIATSPCIAAISVTSPGQEAFDSGRIVQDIWLRALKLGLAAEILYSPAVLFERMKNGDGLDNTDMNKIQRLANHFYNTLKLPIESGPVFLLRIQKSATIATKTNRLALDKILFIVNDEI